MNKSNGNKKSNSLTSLQVASLWGLYMWIVNTRSDNFFKGQPFVCIQSGLHGLVPHEFLAC